MRRRQPDDTFGAEAERQTRILEAWAEQEHLADTLFVANQPAADNESQAADEASAADEFSAASQSVTRKRTLLTQALLIKEQPQKPATTKPTNEEPAALLIRGSSKPPRLARHGARPRSLRRGLVTQVAVAIMALAIFIGGVTTTPLGRNIAGITGFDAYANAIPWIPTPTPTPKPKPQVNIPNYANDPGKQAIVNEIKAVFGSYAAGAIAVATCESGLNPNARNTTPIGNSHAEGVFQILYPSTWSGTPYHSSSPYDYSANIHAAYWIFKKDGYTWREWACKP